MTEQQHEHNGNEYNYNSCHGELDGEKKVNHSTLLSEMAQSQRTASCIIILLDPLFLMATPRILWALQYKYVPDILTLREPYRAAHLAHAAKAVEDGKLMFIGPLGDATGAVPSDPVDGALFIFDKCTRDEVSEYARADPYHDGKLITEWTVRQWSVVMGTAK